jgi:hypothetical protein
MSTVTQIIQKLPEHLRFAVKSPGILGILAVILLAAPAGAQTQSMTNAGSMTQRRAGLPLILSAIAVGHPLPGMRPRAALSTQEALYMILLLDM